MHTTKKGFAARLIGIVIKNCRKVIRNTQDKRVKKDRTELQAALMSGSIRRIK